MEENKIKEPKLHKVLRIVGALLLVAGITLVVLSFVFQKQFNGHNVGPSAALLVPGAFVTMSGLSMLMFGFLPMLKKQMIRTQRYIQQETKQDQQTIADTGAEIIHGAVKETAKAVKEGFKDSVYCKHCGKQIDADAKFCKHCGKEQ